MPTSFKSQEIASFLAEELAARLGVTATISYDATAGHVGNPLIQVGTSGIGAQGCLIRVAPIYWIGATDIFGNTANQYVPHHVQIIMEASAALATAPVCTPAFCLAVWAAAAATGCRVLFYLRANGTAPIPGDAVAATAATATFEPTLKYNMTSMS